MRARQRVLSLLPKQKVGAEIGVWKGDFSQEILRVAQPKQLLLIDPWKRSDADSHKAAWYGKDANVNMDEVYESVTSRFQSDSRVVIRRQNSADALFAMNDNSLDFIYIDGDHSYDAVRSDLELAVRKVKKSGVIAGDDYTLGRWWGDGVVRAVNEFIGSNRVIVQFLAGGQFVLQRLGES